MTPFTYKNVYYLLTGNEVTRGYRHFQLGKRDADQQEPEGTYVKCESTGQMIY